MTAVLAMVRVITVFIPSSRLLVLLGFWGHVCECTAPSVEEINLACLSTVLFVPTRSVRYAGAHLKMMEPLKLFKCRNCPRVVLGCFRQWSLSGLDLLWWSWSGLVVVTWFWQAPSRFSSVFRVTLSWFCFVCFLRLSIVGLIGNHTICISFLARVIF